MGGINCCEKPDEQGTNWTTSEPLNIPKDESMAKPVYQEQPPENTEVIPAIQQPVAVKAVAKTEQYWNTDLTGEDLQDKFIDYADNWSVKIFNLLNKIRRNPEEFVGESQEYQFEEVLQKYQQIEEKSQSWILNYEMFYAARDILWATLSNQKSDDDWITEIHNLERYKSSSLESYLVTCNLKEPNTAVWNLLYQEGESALNNLLMINPEMCCVLPYPILDSNSLKVIFWFATKA